MIKQHSTAFLKRRKFLMVLPLLVLPFVTMAFWALGGGSVPGDKPVMVLPGLNTILPDADVKANKTQDKMSLYDLVEKDPEVIADPLNSPLAPGSNQTLTGFRTDPNETAIQLKLAQIKSEINSPPDGAIYSSQGSSAKAKQASDPGMTADVAKLEALMKNMHEPAGEDPEMVQLNSLMDKILAAQNPGLERMTQSKSVPAEADSLFKAIPAVIASSQKAIQGSVVELRLLDTIKINGQVIPKGHSVFGLAEFSNQRLNLQIKNIRLGTSVIPVNLTVFDKRDAMQGINAPEALLAGAINGGSSDAIGSIGLMGIDQNLTTQIAGAGLDAAKSLFNKKIKRVKQKLKAGYPLLLRDNQPKRR